VKDDLLYALNYWTTIGQAITWLLITAAALLTGFAGWTAYRLGHLTGQHIAQRRATRRGIRRAECFANHPANQPRKEQL
jgi:membrane protein DedA with SNARE-associated domain